jgi:hypothetical protein
MFALRVHTISLRLDSITTKAGITYLSIEDFKLTWTASAVDSIGGLAPRWIGGSRPNQNLPVVDVKKTTCTTRVLLLPPRDALSEPVVKLMGLFMLANGLISMSPPIIYLVQAAKIWTTILTNRAEHLFRS